MKSELEYLLQLISTILYNKPAPTVPERMEWRNFVTLVSQNGFATLVYEQLVKMNVLSQNILELMKKKYNRDLLRSVLQEHYSEQILNRFEKEGIKTLPLKGIILRQLYPQPYMRSMTDLDILIDTEKLEQTRDIMKELGFEVQRYDEHHDIYHIKPQVNVELHKFLIVGEMEDYFGIGFERAKLREQSSYIYDLSIEDFYIHVIGHMAYHFAHGGVGIRLVLDVRIYLDHYATVMNQQYVKQELEKAGLYTFAKHIEQLSEIWFLGKATNEFYDELGEYIVNSGYLGNMKHKEILEVVKQSNQKVGLWTRFKAVVTAIFLPYREMAFLYPSLKRAPWLLPVTWIRRWIEVFMERRENIARLYRLSTIESDEVRRLGKLYDKLEMRHLL